MTPNLVRLADVREAARSGEARRLRLSAGLSLGEVAREIRVAVPTVLRWETGERRPRGKAALRYGRLLEQLAEREGGP
jgi:DNA-binding transcriptional regulator YiaG